MSMQTASYEKNENLIAIDTSKVHDDISLTVRFTEQATALNNCALRSFAAEYQLLRSHILLGILTAPGAADKDLVLSDLICIG
eukprot:scaffold126477_cov21-Prasinocladus_malaysianus.AAC.1